MPRDDIFDKYPSFPENIAVAELSRLSLWKLLENDAHESEELFRACKETGFFLLDLTASNAGETVLNDADNAFKISREIFDIDQEEQAKYPFELGERFLYGYVSLVLVWTKFLLVHFYCKNTRSGLRSIKNAGLNRLVR